MPRTPGSRGTDYSAKTDVPTYGPRLVDPHSPWQLLVEKWRSEEKVAVRLLASRALIPTGTLFNWLRSKTGAPSRMAYTQDVNKRITKALHPKASGKKFEELEKELADAYNKSAYTPVDPNVIESPRPAPHSLQENSTAFTADGLVRFLQMLKTTGRESFSMAELEFTAVMILGPVVKPLDDDTQK